MAQTMKDILNRMLNHEELSREEMKQILASYDIPYANVFIAPCPRANCDITLFNTVSTVKRTVKTIEAAHGVEKVHPLT